MEQENMPMENMQPEEPVQEPQRPVSPFADSPFEMDFQVEQPNPEPPAKKKKGKVGKRILSVVLVLALLIAACGVTAYTVSGYWSGRLADSSAQMQKEMDRIQTQLNALQGLSGTVTVPTEGMTPGQVYATNVQAVVAISNQGITTNIYGQVSQTASSGSGFIISEDGYVVSNYHVVEGASKLSVITADGTEYPATVVGSDSASDVAVLKIEATGLPFVKFGSSDALVVGDMVAAIGNPLGELTSTLTVGYVSAKDRMVNTDGTYLNMIQTDAAINSGNSGGPLFNMKGEVVGITTAKYSGTSGSGATIEGIGFAIPMDDIADMLTDLIEHGYVTGAYLGVMVRDMNADVSQMYGLPMGVYVDEVTKGSCAEKAGMQAKDIILALGEHGTENMAELTRALRKFAPGDTTTVKVYRGGAEVTLNITLDEKPATTQQEDTQTQQPSVPGNGNFEDWFGSFFPGFGG